MPMHVSCLKTSFRIATTVIFSGRFRAANAALRVVVYKTRALILQINHFS